MREKEREAAAPTLHDLCLGATENIVSKFWLKCWDEFLAAFVAQKSFLQTPSLAVSVHWFRDMNLVDGVFKIFWI